MSTVQTATAPRLGERPLLSGTTMKFVLLIVLIVVTSGSIMAEVAAFLQHGPQDAYGCLLAAGGDPSQYRASLGVTMAHAAAYHACENAHEPPVHWWLIAAWPAVLVAGSALLFRLLPRWKTRGRRLVPLAVVDRDGAIARDLELLATRAGLAAAPRAVVNPTRSSAGAVVYGRTADPTIALHAGLLARRSAAPDRFDAVVLHEYAHVRNGDITLTYATVALWRVFLAVVIGPYLGWSAVQLADGTLIYPLWSFEVPYVVYSYVLCAVLVMLVYLARSDVLRSREIYADRAAVGWGADPRQWTVPDPSAATRASRRAMTAFTELWHVHPRWDLRRNAFTDPSALYIDRSLPMFLTGTAAVLIDASAPIYWPTQAIPAGATAAIALAAAVLVTGVAGIALWRSALYSQTPGAPAPGGLRAGVWLGAGAAFAAIVSSQAVGIRWLPGQPQYLLVLVLAAGAFACWFTQSARLWLAATGGSARARRPVMALVLAAGCVVLWAWFAWWQGTGSQLAVDGMHVDAWRQILERSFPGPSGAHLGMLSAIAVVWMNALWLEDPVILVAVVVLFLLPLSALLLRPRRVLAAAAIGGAAGWLATAGAMAFMHAQRANAGFPSELFDLMYQGWVFVALCVGMAVAGTVAACGTDRRYALLTALAAAAVAGLLGFGGWWALAATDGCLGPLNTMSNVCGWRPGAAWGLGQLLEGPVLFAAVLAGVAGAVLAAGLGRFVFARAGAGSREPGPLARVRLTRGALAVRCLVASLLVAAVAVAAVQVGMVKGQNLSPSTASANVALVAGPMTTVSPQVRQMQVKFWWDYGGHGLFVDIRGDLAQLDTALKAAAADGGNADPSVFKPLCANAVRTATETAAYFPVPVNQVQPAWNTTILDLAGGGRQCLDAFAANNGRTLVDAMDKLAAMGPPLAAVEQAIESALPAPG